MNLLKDLNLDIEKNKKYNLYRWIIQTRAKHSDTQQKVYMPQRLLPFSFSKKPYLKKINVLLQTAYFHRDHLNLRGVKCPSLESENKIAHEFHIVLRGIPTMTSLWTWPKHCGPLGLTLKSAVCNLNPESPWILLFQHKTQCFPGSVNTKYWWLRSRQEISETINNHGSGIYFSASENWIISFCQSR